MSEGSVLVLGATGTVGRPLVAALLARGARVKAASRSRQAAAAGAEPVRFDFVDPATYDTAFRDVTSAYLMLPTGHPRFDQLAHVVTAALDRSVKVVLQTVLSDDLSMAGVAEYLQIESRLRQSGCPYVALRPTWFSDNFHTLWKNDVARGEIALPAGEGEATFIDARDIAECAAVALTTNRFDRRSFDLTGPESLTFGRAASVISEVTGRTVTYSAVDDEAFVAALIRSGVPERGARSLLSVFAPTRKGLAGAVRDGVQELTGHPGRSFESYARDHRADLGV